MASPLPTNYFSREKSQPVKSCGASIYDRCGSPARERGGYNYRQSPFHGMGVVITVNCNLAFGGSITRLSHRVEALRMRVVDRGILEGWETVGLVG